MTTRWIAEFLAVALSVPAWAQSHPIPQPQERFAITALQVAQAISSKGVSVEEGQVSLLTNIGAANQQPALDILSVEPFGNRSEGRSLVRLACHEPGVCLPFYVVVHSAEMNSGDPSKATIASRPVTGGLLKPDAAILMRAGAHATLLMDDERAHIKISVVTLENGIAGHTIRVASPDHKQFYLAEVIGVNLLRRSF